MLGGESQCLSICLTALVHSAMHAFASCSTPAAVGDLLPHIAGLVANLRACFATSCLDNPSAERPKGHRSFTHVLLFDLDENQPAVVPTAHTSRIPDHQTLRLVQALGAEGIIPGQTTKLAEKIVRVHVVGPCRCYGFRNLSRIQVSKDFLDPPQFRDSIHSVCAQRVDELILVVLEFVLAVARKRKLALYTRNEEKGDRRQEVTLSKDRLVVRGSNTL